MSAPVKAAMAAMAPYVLWLKLAVLLLMAVLLFGAGWKINGWRWEAKETARVEALNEQITKDRDEYLLDKAKWEAASQVDAARIESLDAQKDSLLATLSGLKLTRTVTVKADAQGNCVADVIAPDFRLRWNGVVETHAANLAADRGE